MKKLISLLITLTFLVSCNNEPKEPETKPVSDTSVWALPEYDQEVVIPLNRPAARAILLTGQIYDTLANGDTLFYITKDTTVTITTKTNYTYTLERTKLVPKKPGTPQPPVNTAPVARAGSDQLITLPTNTAQLDGSSSNDAESNIKSYGWRKISGPAAIITDSNKAIATLSGLVSGVYVYELRVADIYNLFTADQMTITVRDPVTGGQTVTINQIKIPLTDPDLNAPGRGAEQWHDRTDVPLPTETAPQRPYDVYYRTTWNRFEGATQGSYNWTWFDTRMKDAIDKRQRFSFGIMSVYTGVDGNSGGANYNGAWSAFPQYVHNMMQAENPKDFIAAGNWIPNWNSSAYAARVLALNQALNAHIEATTYNGVRFRDAIGIIDIRSYGNWGEWHSAGIVDDVNQYPAGTFPTAASLKRIVDAYIQGFPNFPLAAMIAGFDAQWLHNTYNPPEIAYYLLTAKNNWGPIGWRRDQWGALDGYLKDYLENNNRSFNGVVFKTLIMERWKTAAITGEPPAWIPDNYSDLERQVKLYHAASFGNGNYGTNTPSTTIKDRVRAASKACGYRLVIETGGQITVNPGSVTVNINWRNAGQAPTYENWQVAYELVNTAGLVVFTAASSFKPKLFLPGATVTFTETFSTSVLNGQYRIRVVIKDPNGYRPNMPIYNTARNADNSVNLATINLSP